MARRLASIAVAIFGIFFITSLAWAVAVNVNVTDQDGKPVPGTVVSLTSDDPSVGTIEVTDGGKGDEDGEVNGTLVISVKKGGKYGLGVRASDHVQQRRDIDVPTEGALNVSVTLHVIRAHMGRSGWGGWGLMVKGGGMHQSTRVEVTRDVETQRIPEFDFEDTTVTDPKEVNDNFPEINVTTTGGGGGFGGSLPAFEIWDNAWIYAAVNVSVSAVEAKLNKNGKNPNDNENFKGTDALVGTGIDATLQASPWFVGGGFAFQTIPGGVGLERSPPLSGVQKDVAELHYHSYSVYGLFGLNLLDNRVGPWVGVRGTWTDVELDTRTESTFGPFTSITDAKTEFEQVTAVYGISGVDVYFGSSFFGRFEAAYNDKDLWVGGSLIYAIGLE